MSKSPLERSVQIFLILGICLFTRTSNAEVPLSLSLKQAIQLSFQNNLTVLTATERQNEARGREQEALSRLLPNFYATASQFNNTQNLAALGFPVRFFPFSPLIGPYNTFDARLQLAQTLFDLSAYHTHQASQADVQVALLQKELAREQTAAATEVAYLNVLASNEGVKSAEANLELALSLQKLATDQHTAGVATGLDVTRAQTRVAAQQVSLSQAQTGANQAQLQFKRLIGVPLDAPIVLTDPLVFSQHDPPALRGLLLEASKSRVELLIAKQTVQREDYSVQAAIGEHVPSLGLSANYGESGNTVGTLSLPTRAIGVHMDIPIFNGELTQGHVREAQSRKRQAELVQTDTQAQVEEDVRLARQTLDTTTQEVLSANQSVQLAERELDLSRDRFAAGLADNVEVIEAQTALENARNAKVSALADYNRTRINLSASTGHAQDFDFR